MPTVALQLVIPWLLENYTFLTSRKAITKPNVYDFFIELGHQLRWSILLQPGVTRFEQLVLPHLDSAANLARWLLRNRILSWGSSTSLILGLCVITVAAGILFPRFRFHTKVSPPGIKPDLLWFMQM